ncbi:MAG: rhodanese-like domain-containing protein [bacterium]
MNIKLLMSIAVSVVLLNPMMVFATPAEEEKKVFAELTALIPKDRIVTVDDLYKKWQEVQEKKSNAVILDIRTGAEFYAGHLKDANNIDSGNPYLVPKTWPDPDTEIWVFCRSQHRATYFTSFLYRYGYKNVYLVHGGIAEWAEKGYPLYSKDFGKIKVLEYDKALKEEYKTRQFD